MSEDLASIDFPVSILIQLVLLVNNVRLVLASDNSVHFLSKPDPLYNH